jgi:hypothetical protein
VAAIPPPSILSGGNFAAQLVEEIEDETRLADGRWSYCAVANFQHDESFAVRAQRIIEDIA